MKLGEALSVRARQAAKLNDLRGRIKSNSLVQEGQQAPEDADSLIEEFSKLSTTHSALVTRINKTNVKTVVTTVLNGDDTTILDLLAEREDLSRQRSILETAASAATGGRDAYRYMRSELATVATVNVTGLRTQIDVLDAQIASLDAKIQAVNWATDLVA